MLGVVLIDKPQGITSHDVVARLRRRFQTKRVGHAGTLDPQATGLVVAAIGPATRFLQYLPLEPKEYVAEITFGKATNTQDGDGEAIEEHPVPDDLEAQFQAHLPKFLGLIQQIPPMYSAVKKDGQPLYKYARRGEEIEREPRTVHIAEILDVEFEGDKVRLRMVCSGGTYVRTWSHDMGQAIGCGAYLSALRRVRVGRFMIEDAFDTDTVKDEDVWPLSEALDTPILTLNERQLNSIRHGQAIGAGRFTTESQVVALADPNGKIVGMARSQGNLLQPECVLPSEAFA